ncbi:MAG: GGDEF domain-containing protein [Lysobacterales bacterium 14-68-21]|nr:MAG: GGDEF domain-containing protein [Xanthomonadales bacterium 15-68-25]OZB67824.1 MAG: GGDEF domain-containing protein [Xanthomonadales bacterium 14-68-21]
MSIDRVATIGPVPPMPAEAPGWVTSGEAGQARVVDSVAHFTHQRDTEALDHSLTLSLAELADARAVTLYKRAGEHAGPQGSVVRCSRNALGRFNVELVPRTTDAAAELLLQQGERDGGCVRLRDGSYGLLVPIRHEGRMIGALMLESEHPLEMLRPLVEGFARIYANYVGLLDESERDKLTALYNRRSFDRHLQRQLHGTRPREGEEGSQTWLAIMDIDHFKRINDTWGHLYGDEVILMIAQQMRASFRRGDALFRFGGEEFVVLLPAVDEAAALAALERFRGRVADHAFPQVGRVTVSIGFAGIGANDYPATVLDRADKALYFAKNHGRNQVFSYEALRARGALEGDVSAGSVDLF